MTTPQTAQVLLSAGPGSQLPDRILLSGRVLDMAPVGMALTDPDGRLLWANDSLARLLARPAAELTGRRLAEVARPAAAASDEAAVAPLLAGTADRVEYVTEWTPADGEPRWVSVTAAVATVPTGQPVTMGLPGSPCLILQVSDITEHKRISDALQAAHDELEHRNNELQRSNDDLTQFAYVASHDLSEPLRVVAGHVELLARRYRGQLDDDADQWIHFAVDGCARMRRLIDDLLAYSRAGRAEMATEPVDLSAVAARVAASLTSAEEAGAVTVDIGPLPVVDGNPVQLHQVLANLVGNAVKFRRPDRHPVVRLSAERAGSEWRFLVSDNGIGIEPAYRERVFGIFQRLHGQDAYPGTGIGLAITRRIVERHGGRVWIEEGESGGSAFVFTLPCRG